MYNLDLLKFKRNSLKFEWAIEVVFSMFFLKTLFVTKAEQILSHLVI